jgi:hypothetical protein
MGSTTSITAGRASGEALDIERDGDRDRRHEAERQDPQRDVLLTGHLHATERIGRHDAEDDHDRAGHQGNDGAVHQHVRELEFREQVGVVLGRRREDEDRDRAVQSCQNEVVAAVRWCDLRLCQRWRRYGGLHPKLLDGPR